MGCCIHGGRTASPPPPPARRREEILLQISNAIVHLAGDLDSAVELGRGDFTIVNITEDALPLATVVRVGRNLSWPLTKDEPVVKLDCLHYLFTVADQDGGFLNYGVTFAAPDSRLASLDQFLNESSCFSTAPSAVLSSSPTKSYQLYWKDYGPNVEDYNGVLANAIAQGSGAIVKGIFKLSNAYTSQVQKGASLMQPQADGKKNGVSGDSSRKHGGFNKTLRRVRKLSELTEVISRALLDGVLTMTGTVAAPLVRSTAGKSLFSTVPGEVLLSSLDVVAKVLEAVEAAERNAFAATTAVVSGTVSKRFGKNAGEGADDVLATAGHAIGTAWNVFKIRKAVNPKSYVTSAVVNSAGKKNRS